MDKLFALAVLIIVVVMIAAIYLYLKMDRLRFRAGRLAEMLGEAFGGWAEEASVLFDGDERKAAAAAALKERTTEGGVRIIGAVNAYHALVKETVAAGVDDPKVIVTGKSLTQRYMTFADLREEYNGCAIRMNRLLGGKAAGAFGRALRFGPFEKMNDLSVL